MQNLRKIHGAYAIVKCLERAGIELVLGIPGLYNMPIFDALYRHPTIRVITVRHEQGAAFMADGYARATGKAAAILTLPGPGLTNALTGIGEAYSDSSPMLILSTQVNRDLIDQERGVLHEMTGQFEMLDKLTKYSERIMDGGEILAVFSRAMHAMQTGRPRPVQIEIPRDIQVEMVPWNDEEMQPLSEGSHRDLLPLNQDQLDQIQRTAAMLAQAERPLIYAGGGVIASGASIELVALAEQLGAPVITTGMGVGAIPSDHPLWCGVPWIAGGANVADVVAACDALLAVGTRFNQGMTANWSLPLPETTIRIDIDPDEIDRNIQLSQKIVGDAKAVLGAINTALGIDGASPDSSSVGVKDRRLAAAQRQFMAGLRAKTGQTTPWMQALRDALPRDGILCCDMTLFWADMLSIFPIYEPRSMLFPWGFGTLGFGLPEALGAKLGCPEKGVVAIVGDGAFLFTGGELATAVQYGLNIPIIVPNNNAYGMIKVQQRDQYDGQFMGVDLVNPDFMKLAEAFGINGERVSTPEAFSLALTNALDADKPTLIEIPWGWTWGNEL